MRNLVNTNTIVNFLGNPPGNRKRKNENKQPGVTFLEALPTSGSPGGAGTSKSGSGKRGQDSSPQKSPSKKSKASPGGTSGGRSLQDQDVEAVRPTPDFSRGEFPDVPLREYDLYNVYDNRTLYVELELARMDKTKREKGCTNRSLRGVSSILHGKLKDVLSRQKG